MVTLGNMPRNRRTRTRRPDPERDSRRAARRAELLAAADAVLRRDGPGASMSAIAAHAGVTKPILYKHFGDKGGLYRALAERYLGVLLERLRAAVTTDDQPRERIRSTIDAYLTFIESEKEVYGFLMHRALGEQAEAQATVAGFIRELGDEIGIVLGEELRRAGLDSGAAEPWAHGMVGMVYLAGDRWLTHRTMPRARLVDYLTDLLWHGFENLGASAAAVTPAAS